MNPKIVEANAFNVEEVAKDAGIHIKIEDESDNCSDLSLEIDWDESNTLLEEIVIADEYSVYFHVADSSETDVISSCSQLKFLRSYFKST